MSIVINIILILASLVLIVAVLMQEGNKQGLGAIGGAAETFLGKNKAKSYEGKLLNITRITAAVFVVLAIVATWMNSRTYTVTYYDENGKEFFPYLYATVEVGNGLGQSNSDYDSEYAAALASYKEAGQSEKDLQKVLRGYTSYEKGKSIFSYETPDKEGYSGTWVIDENNNHVWDEGETKTLPANMGTKDYAVVPMYEIRQFTITVVDNGILPEEEIVTEDAEAVEATETAEVAETTEAAEEEKADNVIFTFTANYGEAIEYPAEVRSDLPLREGDCYVFYSTDKNAVADGYIYNLPLPEKIPAGDFTYYVCYAKGGFVSYFVKQDDVETAVLDDEGNAVLDEEGNPVTEITVGEEVEWYPDLQNDLYSSLMEQWDEAYGASYGDDYESYINDFGAFISGEGADLLRANYQYSVAQYKDRPDVIRTFIPFGSEVKLNDVPVAAEEGFVAEWYVEDGEIPEIMDGNDYELRVRFVEAPAAAEEAVEDETAEPAPEAETDSAEAAE